MTVAVTSYVPSPAKRKYWRKSRCTIRGAAREAVWERVQLRNAELLSDWRTDLGGKKNFHNGKGGNYDCIALMAYYVVCREVTSLSDIEEM